jgi:hypothetical protein
MSVGIVDQTHAGAVRQGNGIVPPIETVCCEHKRLAAIAVGRAIRDAWPRGVR